MRQSLPTRRQAAGACVLVALAVLACAGLMSAAVEVPAPAAVIPLLVVVCIGVPMLLAWSLPAAISVLVRNEEARALKAMRRHLDRLPETKHPLGL